jgi:post-segregation antitoxin (ccd killing protein)
MERITVYVPEEMKDYLKKRKVSMSQFCRNAIRNHIKILADPKWQEYHRNEERERMRRKRQNPEFREKGLRYREEWLGRNTDRYNAYQAIRRRDWLNPENFDNIPIGVAF